LNLLPILALVALTTVTDPSGDAFGDGTLTPPTAPIYANVAVFDLQSVTLDKAEQGTRLAVTLGSLGLPADKAAPSGADASSGAAASGDAAAPGDAHAAGDGDVAGHADLTTLDGPIGAAAGEDAGEEAPLEGFLPAVVDVYLGAVTGGSSRTLPGPDLGFPDGTGWEYAVRITSAGAFFVTYPQTTDEPPKEPDEPVDVSSLPRRHLDVYATGNTLVVYLPVTLAADTQIHAMTGVYDPFSASGWRGLSETPSPWQYSGATAQQSPVVDLIARNADAQRDGLRSGVLPRAGNESSLWKVPWLWVMVAGLLVAVAGLVMRGRVRKPQPAVADEPSAAEGATAPEATQPPEPKDAEGAVDAEAPMVAEPEDAAEVAEPEDPVEIAGPEDAVGVAESEDATGVTEPEDATEVAVVATPPPPEANEDQSSLETLTAPEDGAADGELEGLVGPEPTTAPADGAADGEPEGQAGPESTTPADETGSAATEPGPAGSDPFGTAVEESFLLSLDDPRAITDLLSEDDAEESFWHPRARRVQVGTPEAGDAASHQDEAGVPGNDEDEGAG